MFKDMMGKAIKIDRGGPESRIGKLLDVYDDHLVLLTKEDGVVYYNTYHIKSVTENSKEQLELKVEIPENFEYKKASNFQSLMDTLKYQWVKINRGGPEKMEGILCDINKDIVTIVSKEEIVRISMFHIRNISYGFLEKANEEKKSENKSQDSNEKTSHSEAKHEKTSDEKSESQNKASSDQTTQSDVVLEKTTIENAESQHQTSEETSQSEVKLEIANEEKSEIATPVKTSKSKKKRSKN